MVSENWYDVVISDNPIVTNKNNLGDVKIRFKNDTCHIYDYDGGSIRNIRTNYDFDIHFSYLYTGKCSETQYIPFGKYTCMIISVRKEDYDKDKIYEIVYEYDQQTYEEFSINGQNFINMNGSGSIKRKER